MLDFQPSRIHVSEATAKLLEQTDYLLEYRGEVEVKVGLSDIRQNRTSWHTFVLLIKGPFLCIEMYQPWAISTK